ncbi:hypothetical protein P9112_002759 [Eukaryota sp. TZLM1-RC]
MTSSPSTSPSRSHNDFEGNPSSVSILSAATEQLYRDRLALVAAHTRQVMSDWAEHKKLETKDRVLARIQENLEVADSKYDDLRSQMEEEFHQLRVNLAQSRNLPSTPPRSPNQPLSPLLSSVTEKLRREAREKGFKKVEQRLKQAEAQRILDHQKRLAENAKFRKEQARTTIQEQIDIMKDLWTRDVEGLLRNHFDLKFEFVRLDCFDCFRLGGENALWKFQLEYVWNVTEGESFDWNQFECDYPDQFPGFYPIADNLRVEMDEGFIYESTLKQIRLDTLNDLWRRVSSDCHAVLFHDCQQEGERREALLAVEKEFMMMADDVSNRLESDGFFNGQHLSFLSEIQSKRAEILETLTQLRQEKLEEEREQSIKDAEELLRQAEENVRESTIEGLEDDFIEREKELIRQEIAKREAEMEVEHDEVEQEEESLRVKRIAEKRLIQEDKRRLRDARRKQRELKEMETRLRAKLIEGTIFLKHGKKGKPHHRFIWISPDFSLIQWRDPSKAKVRDALHADSVTDVCVGQTTAIFRRRSGNPGRENLSFSLIAGDRTLDLEAASEEERDSWVEAFRYLVALNHPGFGGYNLPAGDSNLGSVTQETNSSL